jgi:hypothetical protein
MSAFVLPWKWLNLPLDSTGFCTNQTKSQLPERQFSNLRLQIAMISYRYRELSFWSMSAYCRVAIDMRPAHSSQ